MANYIQLPNGAYYPALPGEDYQTTIRAAYTKYPEAFGEQRAPEEQPKSGFMPSVKGAISDIKGAGAALAGRTGIMELPAAEKYIAEQEAYKKKTYAPTTKSFIEDPLANIAELAGGSIPYMVAPLAAGAALGSAPVAGALGLGAMGSTALGLGAAGAASAGQFAGSNLIRQTETGKKLGETDLTNAVLASIPQAALDTISLRMIPGMGKIFGKLGFNLSEKAAQDLAKEGLKKTAADYVLTTGKTMTVEGLTEAGQQVFERMQAGLNLTDPSARAEYFDNFIGGAVLGGILAPVGRRVERGAEQGRFDKQQREEQKAQADAARVEQEKLDADTLAQKQTPEYAQQAQQSYLDAEKRKADLQAQFHKAAKGEKLTEDQKQDNRETQQALNEHADVLKEAKKEFRLYRQFLPKEAAPPLGEDTTQLQQRDMFGNLPVPKALELDLQGKPLERTETAEETLANEKQRSLYGPESQQAQLQQTFDMYDATVGNRGKFNAPETLLAENPDVQQIQALSGYLDNLRDQSRALPNTALKEKQALAEKYGAVKNALDQIQSTMPVVPAAPDIANINKQINALNKKMQDADTNGELDLVGKYAAKIEDLQNKLAPTVTPVSPQQEIEMQPFTSTTETTEQMEARKAKDLEDQRLKALQVAETPKGETQNLFTAAEAPVPTTPQAPVTKYLQDQGAALKPEQVTALEAPAAPAVDTGPTTDEVKRKLAIQTAEHIGGQIAQLKRETEAMTSRRYLADYQGAPNPEVTNKFAQMNELQRQFDTLTEQYAQTQPEMKALDLFDPTNMLQTAVQNGDIDAINRLTQQRKQQDLMDRNKRREVKKAENDRLIASLDERLGLGGEELATKTGEPLSSVKSTRISEGPAYDALVDNIQAIKDKVEKVQGNAKYSIRDRLDVIAAEHEQKKAVYTDPKSTSRQKTGALRRMNTLVNEFNGIVETHLDPAIKEIEKLHTQFRKIEPVKKVSEVKVEKAALSRVEGKDIRMSPEARQAKRINEGRIAPEIENSKAAKEVAIELGRQMPEYQKQLDEMRRRLQALKEKYGPDDKQVEIYKQNAVKQLGENALKLGRTTPEYAASLKEVVAALQESYESAGKQEIASKRTQQVTRKTNVAPREQSGISSRSAKQELRQRQQNLVKDFTEGMQSEKPSTGMRSDIQGYNERSKLSRGVEVESPDLTTEQVKHIDNNDIQAAFTNIANDPKASPLNRAVAQRLASVLDNTDVRAEDNLTDNGDEILGRAISTEVVLNRQSGMNQEVLLHEGTHAAVERVIQLYESDPSKLTETQRIAMRELQALYAAVKKDPSITSANAKGSLSEFAAEILSNRNLQEQLRSKKWKMSDAWQGVKSIILRLLGFSKAETETMLGAGIQAVDALMVPSSVRGLNRGVEKAISGVRNVPYSNAQKDIAALHTGSNSMKQFSEAFGIDIKQKDRTPEDVERIAQDYLESVVSSPEDHIATPYTGNSLLKQDESTLTQEQKDNVAKLKTLMVELEEFNNKHDRRYKPPKQNTLEAEAARKKYREEKKKIETAINEQDLKMSSLDYRVRMPDGENLNLDNPLHYAQATGPDLVMAQAQEDPGLRRREAEHINAKRTTELRDLAGSLDADNSFTAAERALVLKAAGKYSVTSDDNGRLKLVNISPNNRHDVAIVSSADAAFVIQKLREGLPLKQAFLEGLQENANRNAAVNQALNKNGWQKFDQVPENQDALQNVVDTQKAAEELNAACAGTPWCTGNSMGHARGQIEGGDFYVYYKDGKAQVAVRMDGQEKIGEVRGTLPGQALTPEQQKIADNFLISKNFANTENYINEFKRKAALIDLAKGEEITDANLIHFERAVADNVYIENKFGNGLDEILFNKNPIEIKYLFKFEAIDGYGGRPAPSEKVIDFFSTKFKNMLAKEYAKNNFIGVAIGSENAANLQQKPYKFLFDGKKYIVDPKTVKGIGGLWFYGDIDISLPALEKIYQLEIVENGFCDFPALKDLYRLTVGGGNVNINTAPGAIINALITQDYKAGVHKVFLNGAETIRFLDLTSDSGAVKLIAPDLLYAPKQEPVLFDEYTVGNSLARHISDRFNEGPETADAVRDFIKYLPAKFTVKARAALRQEHPQGLKDVYVGDLTNTVTRSIEAQNPTQKEIFEIYKAINSFMNSKEFAEHPGKLIAPNLIADAPPVQRLTEAPEAPRYAKVGVGKDKDGNSFFRTRTEATSLGSSFIAQETSAKDKFLGNVMGLTGRVQFVDKDAALSAALKKGVDVKAINSLEAQNAEYFLRFGQNTSQLAGQALTNGSIRIREGKGGGYIYESVKGPNMMDAAQALEKGKFKNDTEGEAVLTAYVAGLKADVVGWEKLNYENPAKVKQEHAQIMAMLNANPEKMAAVKEAARIYKEFNDGQLDFAAQAGYLSKEKVAELKRTPYIPFYRVNSNNNVELMIDKEHAIRIGNIKDEPQLHALVGDNKQILPIFTSAVQNTFMLTNMALRNKAVQESAFMLHKMGIASVISRGVGPANANTVRFQVKGVPHFVTIDTDMYGIPADLIVKGMEGIKTSMPALVQMMGAPATLLRNFIVRNPAYALRQVIRDPMTAWLTTGTDATPILSSMRELASMVAGRSETEAKLMSTGAISSNVFTGDQRDMSKFLKQISTGQSGWAKGMAKLDAFALQGDAATRAVVYKDSLDKGMSEQAALLRTLESMNFGRRGVSPSVQWLNTMIPFFNAQIQGLDVLYRAFKGDMPYSEQLKIRQKMVARGLMLAAGTMAYAAMMQDDEAYKRAKPEERYGNWFVYVPGSKEPLKIPVPFELGYLFKSLPEAVFNLAAGDEKAKTAIGGMLTLIDQSNPFQLPAAIKPLTEVALGKSFFGGDIESAREKKILPAERVRDTTTEAAKLLAQLTGNEEIRKLTGREGISAISLDHLIRGYTGSLGIALVQLANPLLNTEVSADVPQPTKPMSKQPFIGGLFQPVEGRGTLDAAYNQMEYIQQVKGTFDDMVAKGRVAEARAFMQEHVAEMALVSVSGAVQKQLGELAKQERMIRAAPNLSTERKDELLARLDQIKTKIARGSMAVYERTKDRTDRS